MNDVTTTDLIRCFLVGWLVIMPILMFAGTLWAAKNIEKYWGWFMILAGLVTFGCFNMLDKLTAFLQ